MLFLDDDYDYKENNSKKRLKMERVRLIGAAPQGSNFSRLITFVNNFSRWLMGRCNVVLVYLFNYVLKGSHETV